MKVKKYKASVSNGVVTDSRTKQCLPLHGFWGILMLFVFVSSTYATYMIWVGTQGVVPKIMLAPLIAFNAYVAIYKFSSN